MFAHKGPQHQHPDLSTVVSGGRREEPNAWWQSPYVPEIFSSERQVSGSPENSWVSLSKPTWTSWTKSSGAEIMSLRTVGVESFLLLLNSENFFLGFD